MTCPHCGALLYRRSGDRILLVCRKPWISASMQNGRVVVAVVMDCLRCRRQVRIIDLAAEMARALDAERTVSGCT